MSFLASQSPLPFEDLSARIDPASLPFATTADAEVEPFRGVIGQETARDAIAFGLVMDRPGYNVFVAGDAGTGRLSLARNLVEEFAGKAKTPCDWLYLNNFAEPREPIALRLPAGEGKALLADMERLLDGIIATFPSAFESPRFQRSKADIERAFAQRYNEVIDQIESRSKDHDIALFRDGENISFSPMREGRAVSEEEFAAFSEEGRECFHHKVRELEDDLANALVELPLWRRETGERIHRLIGETINLATAPLLSPFSEKYSDQPEVLRYLEAIRGDLPGRLVEQSSEEKQSETLDEAARRNRLSERYLPRLFVFHLPETGAPVIYEANPTYQNLFGRIEYANEEGVLVTQHRLICPGTLHQANGGYLLLEAEKMTGEPHVWPALKRALKNRLIRIESPFQDESVPAVMTLSPEPIPLNVKIVLIGERDLYYLLQDLDGEFNELFRVLADFEDFIPRNDESIMQTIALVKGYSECSGFAPMSAQAAARLIEFSGRLAEHQERLSARIGDLYEMTAEAEAVRREEGSLFIEESHIARALVDRERRLDRMSGQLMEEMLEGRILIGTEGEAVGRINGLTVLEMGGRRFGMPARITATVSPGGRGVVDIEREAQLGQSIHSKGVMILAGYLAHKYARDFPLAVSANLALEQSYGYVDGDSAALAELLALISALTGVTIRQYLAVTGSINQYGDVQAVGGVNEKIEGFFQLCKARGFNHRQGVIIPKVNSVNLMLDMDVVESARHGEFSVYAVDTVDEALTLVFGKPAKSVHRLAVSRLRTMAEWVKRQ